MSPKVGRNDPCPCGSGKKYKRCCIDQSSAPTAHTEEDVLGAMHEVLGLATALRDFDGDDGTTWYERVFESLEYEDILWESAHVDVVGTALVLAVRTLGLEQARTAEAFARSDRLSPLASALWLAFIRTPPRLWRDRLPSGLTALDRPMDLVKVDVVLNLRVGGDPLVPADHFWGWCLALPSGQRITVRVIPLPPADLAEAVDVVEDCAEHAIGRGVPDSVWWEATVEILEDYLWADPDLDVNVARGDGEIDDLSWDDDDDWDDSARPEVLARLRERILERLVGECVRPGALLLALAGGDGDACARAFEAARQSYVSGLYWLRAFPDVTHDALAPLTSSTALLGLDPEGPAGDATLDQLVALPCALLDPDPAALGRVDVNPSAPIRHALRVAAGPGRAALEAELAAFRRERRFTAILRAGFEVAGSPRGLRYATLMFGLDELFPALPRDTPLTQLALPKGVLSRLVKVLELPEGMAPTVAHLPEAHELRGLPGFGEKSQDALVEALHAHLESWRWRRAGLDPSAPTPGAVHDAAAAQALEAGLAKLDDLFG